MRSFFENLGYWKAAAEWVKVVKGSSRGWVGAKAIPTQVVDFHGNSG
jgi:hypothetical protein